MKPRLVDLAAAVLTVICGCAVISGCTVNLARPAPTSSARSQPAVATLPLAWSAQPGSRWSPRNLSSVAPAFWTTATAFVVPGQQSLTSYSSATGARQWNLKLPEPLCTIASGPNSTGVGALMMGTGGLSDSGGCGRAGAVDLRTGRLLWTTSLKGLSHYGLTDVAVGPAAVVATSPCDTAVTMAVRTGKILVKLPAKTSQGCLNNWASDGTTLVNGQKFDPHGGLVGYDVLSGRRLWTIPSRADAAHHSALTTVHQVISSHPLVVDVSVNQHRFLRTVDAKADTATAFGREGSDSSVSSFVTSAKGRLVVQYARSGAVFSYDPSTGRQTGHVVLNPHEQVGGLRGGALITTDTGDATFASGKLVVRTTDPATSTQRVLGLIDAGQVTGLFGTTSVSGSTLVVASNGALAAYVLPVSGPLASSFPDPVHWRSGDVRPKQAVDLCPGITARTTRAFGFLPPTHAAPANCAWVESTSPSRIVQLTVQSTVSVPIATSTAVQDAHSLVIRLAQPDSATKRPAMTPLAGLGDEAVTTATSTPMPSVTIVVRRANVVVTLYANSDSFDRPQKDTVAFLQHALRLAAQDMVAELDRRR